MLLTDTIVKHWDIENGTDRIRCLFLDDYGFGIDLHPYVRESLTRLSDLGTYI